MPASLVATAGTASVVVVNPDGSTSNAFAIGIVASGPIITDLMPYEMVVYAFDRSVVVFGSGFQHDAIVQWNGSPLSTFVSSPGQLDAQVPVGLQAIPGTAVISVVSGGVTSNPVTYRILAQPPTITSVSPSQVTTGGPAFTLTVSGIGFSPDNNAVYWTNITGTGLSSLAATFVSSTQLTAMIPASLIASPGWAWIGVASASSDVIGGGALSVHVANAVPVITNATPSQVDAGGPGFTITLSGSGFVPGSVLRRADQQVAANFVSSTQLTAAIPASWVANSSRLDLNVFNPELTISNTWPVYVEPVLTGISPASPPAGSGITATGVGIGGCEVRISQSGSQWDLSAYSESSTSLSVRFPAAVVPGPATASVVDPRYGTSSRTIAFTVAPPLPTLTGTVPSWVTAGGPAFPLTVNGTGFTVASVVHWDGAPLPTTFVSATQLAAAVPASLIAIAGVANTITVINGTGPGATSSNDWGLDIRVPAAQISGLAPDQITAGGRPFTLAVRGSGFVATSAWYTGGSKIYWNHAVMPTSFISTTELDTLVPASLIATPGTATVAVVQPDYSSPPPVTFTINSSTPVIGTLSPSQATQGGPSFTLTVSGSTFLAGSVVRWNGSALDTTSLGATQLQAAVPASLIVTAGMVSITVLNPDGTSSAPATFTVNPTGPVITAVSPPKAAAGSPGFMLAVQGFAFDSGATVLWNGSPLPTTVIGPIQLNASVAAGLVALRTTASITVMNASGTVSRAVSFVVDDTPLIESLSPALFTATGPAFTLGVNGIGFANGAVVQWNGSPLATTFVSSSQLTAAVAADLIGRVEGVSVSVANPGGLVSNKVWAPTNPPVPTIFSLQPVSAPAGSAGFSLTVMGTGYLPGATVLWNGAALATIYDDASDLQATVPTSSIAMPGTVNIAVADPGGARSSTVDFSITSGAGSPDGVTVSRIVNAASWRLPIIPGSLISIYGSKLAVQTEQAPGALQASLNGTSVLVDNVAIPVSFVSPDRVDAQLPSDAPVGTSTLVVRVNGGSSPPLPFNVAADRNSFPRGIIPFPAPILHPR
ncbi:MAG: hypothetical protein LAP40_05525 [Acidobacteriia bacterium]|nr:hypothetical protein [Terriglobia bacterium]